MQTELNKLEILAAAQRFVDNGFDDAALKLLKDAGFKGYVIVDKRVTNENDVTEPFLRQFITVDKLMLEVKNKIRKLSRIQDEVLITGPTGTGKELLAHALHGTREGEFKALNCAGLPEHLIESELFGHVRGAFTGAISDKIGLTVAAKNGTLFLDEIGEFPLQAQGKLLRVLQEKKIRPVGSNDTRDINCRFVFATNRDLEKMSEDGQFRIDLLARISTFQVRTTQLRARICDIIPIIESMERGKEIANQIQWEELNGGVKCPHISLKYNVRSLQMLVKRYNILGERP